MDYKKENEMLIKSLRQGGYLKSERLGIALSKIPRHLFVPDNLKGLAYRDIPISIGYDQTISQPTTVVIMTEALDVESGNKILEIGTGSGWQAAILGELAGEKGVVYSIERLKGLAKIAKSSLKKIGMRNVRVFVGDGSFGLGKYKPYDRIIVTAACPDVPEQYLDQLKYNGKLVMPVGNQYVQTMLVITKLKKQIIREEIGSFAFVPLIGKYGFRK